MTLLSSNQINIIYRKTRAIFTIICDVKINVKKNKNMQMNSLYSNFKVSQKSSILEQNQKQHAKTAEVKLVLNDCNCFWP